MTATLLGALVICAVVTWCAITLWRELGRP
jgi:hypothetical protein